MELSFDVHKPVMLESEDEETWLVEYDQEELRSLLDPYLRISRSPSKSRRR